MIILLKTVGCCEEVPVSIGILVCTRVEKMRFGAASWKANIRLPATQETR